MRVLARHLLDLSCQTSRSSSGLPLLRVVVLLIARTASMTGCPLLILVDVNVRAIARRLVRGQLVNVGLTEGRGCVGVVLLLSDGLVVLVQVVVRRVGRLVVLLVLLAEGGTCRTRLLLSLPSGASEVTVILVRRLKLLR